MLRRGIAILWLLAGVGLMALFGWEGAWAYPLGRETVWTVATIGMAAWVAADLPLLVAAFRAPRRG